jgi:hypothetical protein
MPENHQSVNVGALLGTIATLTSRYISIADVIPGGWRVGFPLVATLTDGESDCWFPALAVVLNCLNTVSPVGPHVPIA